MRSLPAPALLFDCDGVLVDSDDSVVTAWTRWAADYGLDANEVVAVVHGRRSADSVAALLPASRYDEALTAIDRYEVESAETVRAVPGAVDLLASLPTGMWAVVTSGRRALARARLTAAGLPIPQVLITADDVSRGKPDPEGYLAAASSLGRSAQETLVLEDSPDGIRAARSAGVRWVVGVGSRALASEPDALVVDLSQVTWDGRGLVVEGDAR